MATMRTLFLNPPSFEGFDGGAGARYQARREIYGAERDNDTLVVSLQGAF